jgi:hypothetical protein
MPSPTKPASIITIDVDAFGIGAAVVNFVATFVDINAYIRFLFCPSFFKFFHISVFAHAVVSFTDAKVFAFRIGWTNVTVVVWATFIYIITNEPVPCESVEAITFIATVQIDALGIVVTFVKIKLYAFVDIHTSTFLSLV